MPMCQKRGSRVGHAFVTRKFVGSDPRSPDDFGDRRQCAVVRVFATPNPVGYHLVLRHAKFHGHGCCSPSGYGACSLHHDEA